MGTFYCLHCSHTMTHVPSDSTQNRFSVYYCSYCKVYWKRIYAINATDCDSWMIIDRS